MVVDKAHGLGIFVTIDNEKVIVYNVIKTTFNTKYLSQVTTFKAGLCY